MVREVAPWFALWAFALYLTAVGYVWEARGESILAILAAIAVLGCITSLIAKGLQGES